MVYGGLEELYKLKQLIAWNSQMGGRENTIDHQVGLLPQPEKLHHQAIRDIQWHRFEIPSILAQAFAFDVQEGILYFYQNSSPACDATNNHRLRLLCTN